MKKLNFDGPINSLSLGNVSVNFLRELRKKDLDIGLFPVGDKGEFDAYDKIDEDFKKNFRRYFTNQPPKKPKKKVDKDLF